MRIAPHLLLGLCVLGLARSAMSLQQPQTPTGTPSVTPLQPGQISAQPLVRFRHSLVISSSVPETQQETSPPGSVASPAIASVAVPPPSSPVLAIPPLPPLAPKIQPVVPPKDAVTGARFQAALQATPNTTVSSPSSISPKTTIKQSPKTSGIGFKPIYIIMLILGAFIIFTGYGQYRTTLFLAGCFIAANLTLAVLRIVINPYLERQALADDDDEISDRAEFIMVVGPLLVAVVGAMLALCLVQFPNIAIALVGGALLGSSFVRIVLIPIPASASMPVWLPLLLTAILVLALTTATFVFARRGHNKLGKVLAIVGTSLAGAVSIVVSIDMLFDFGINALPGSKGYEPLLGSGTTVAAISELVATILIGFFGTVWQLWRFKRVEWFGQGAFESDLNVSDIPEENHSPVVRVPTIGGGFPPSHVRKQSRVVPMSGEGYVHMRKGSAWSGASHGSAGRQTTRKFYIGK